MEECPNCCQWVTEASLYKELIEEISKKKEQVERQALIDKYLSERCCEVCLKPLGKKK